MIKKLSLQKLFILMVLFSSCSMSSKINRSAKKDMLSNEAFITAHTGISIYEPASQKFWFNYQGDKYFVPASNTKLLSCYLMMKYMGDSIPGLKYHQVDESTVEVSATGDPTFLRPDFRQQPIYDFLKKFRNVKIVQPSFDNFMGNGWSWNDYTEYYSAARSEFPIYGNTAHIEWNKNGTVKMSPSYFDKNIEIVDKLSTGFDADRLWDKNIFTFKNGSSKSGEITFFPDNATLKNLLEDTLKKSISFISNATLPQQIIFSQPVDSMLTIMMHESDNFFAEQSLLMVSEKMLGKMDNRKIIDTLLNSTFDFFPQKPSWADGSGLSRYNLFTPQDFVALLGKMKDDIGMERIKTILPTGGTGTISSYYKSDSGYIFVKTGTLNGVVALSGFLYTKKNKLLLFSVLVNNHRGSSTAIRKGVEKFIQNLRDKY